MDISKLSTRVFLSAGGLDPRLEIYDLERAEVCKSFHLPAFHSIYTLNLDIEKNQLAAGTKGGLIIICKDILSVDIDALKAYSLIQGAPILSLCWLDGEMLAVSDTTGRCLIWRPARHRNPQSLPTGTAPFCSLCNLPNGQLAGLTTNGALYVWDLLEAKIVAHHRVPLPPKPSALVSMIYWDEAKALLFPACDGNLVLYHFSDNQISMLQVHEGVFYGLTTRNGHLLSVGAEDGCLKVWSKDGDKPIDVFRVCKGIISLAVVGESGTCTLLVDIHGKAKVFRPRQSGLVSDHSLAGRDYRLATTPKAESIKAFERAKAQHTVNQLLKQYILKRESMSASDHKGYFQQIINLGFPHIVLALKAEQFERSDELDESLKMRHALIEMLPLDDHKTYPSRLKYAANLESVWLIQAAYSQYLKIQSDGGTVDDMERFLQLQQMTKILNETEDWIIDSDIPVETIIKSNTIIGAPFHGRYILYRLPALNCNQAVLDIDTIARKYNQLRQSNGNRATSAKLWMISRSEVEQRAVILFEPIKRNKNSGLVLAWDVSQGEQETLVNPMVIFVWQPVEKADDVEQVNNIALKQIQRSLTDKGLHQGVFALQKNAQKALRRLLTFKISKGQIDL